MTPQSAVVAVRFAHLLATATLFGLALFSLCNPEVEATGPPFAKRLRSARIATVLASAASGIVVLYSTAANMAGSWSDLNLETFREVVLDTSFGEISAARLVLAVLVILLCLPRRMTRWQLALTVASGALLASAAGTGHATDGVGLVRALHISADVLHLLAAGAWLGGITALLILLVRVSPRSPPQHIEIASTASADFAGLGALAVAVLLLTGLVNSWLLVGSPSAMVSTDYGRVLSVKLVLFAAMLLFAALNRFWLVPHLQQGRPRTECVQTLKRLRRHVLAEQLLGAAVILAVAFLGTMAPAVVAAAG